MRRVWVGCGWGVGRLCAGWGQGAGRVREVRGPRYPRPTAHPVLVAVAVLEDELGVVVSDLDTRRHVTCQVRGPG